MEGNTVIVRGLRESLRAFAEAEAILDDELRAALLEAGAIVETAAHGFIRSKGLVDGARSTGRLDRMTRATKPSKTGRVFVRSSAMRTTGKNAPYSYPKVWEFARGGARAFLAPALEASEGAVISRVEHGLERVGTRWAEA